MLVLKRTSHFSKTDQRLAVNVTWKSDGNVTLGKHAFDLSWCISCIGRKKKEPVGETTKVVVICLLSSRPLMITVFDLFDNKVLSRGDTQKRVSDQDYYFYYYPLFNLDVKNKVKNYDKKN